MLNLILKKEREKLGYSQNQMAKEIGISKNSVYNYETGDRTPEIETLKKYAVFFNVSTDYLLGLSEFKNYKEEQAFRNQEESVIKFIDDIPSDLKSDITDIFNSLQYVLRINPAKISHIFEYLVYVMYETAYSDPSNVVSYTSRYTTSKKYLLSLLDSLYLEFLKDIKKENVNLDEEVVSRKDVRTDDKKNESELYSLGTIWLKCEGLDK